MKEERTLTVQECAEWKIEVAIQELTKIKGNPDLMHTQDGLDILSSVKDIATDLTEWLESKKQGQKAHVLPGGE